PTTLVAAMIVNLPPSWRVMDCAFGAPASAYASLCIAPPSMVTSSFAVGTCRGDQFCALLQLLSWPPIQLSGAGTHRSSSPSKLGLKTCRDLRPPRRGLGSILLSLTAKAVIAEAPRPTARIANSLTS